MKVKFNFHLQKYSIVRPFIKMSANYNTIALLAPNPF